MNKSERNKKSWNDAYTNFDGWCSLPSWGPYEIASNLKLFHDIENKTFLEIACGSGHSIKYLLDRKAKFVTGIDFSPKQIELSSKTLEKYTNFSLLEKSMEDDLNLSDIDFVFSIYGLGWSMNIDKTLQNIHSYMTKEGKFIFSWDHSFFTHLSESNGIILIKDSYFNEEDLFLENWGNDNGGAYVMNKKISTWYSILSKNGFWVEEIIEPEPYNLKEDIEKQGEDLSNYYSRNKVSKIPSTMIFVCRKK